MSYSTAKMTDKELNSKITVNFPYHKERGSVLGFLKARDAILALSDDRFFNHGGHESSDAIADALNLYFGTRWWANHG